MTITTEQLYDTLNTKFGFSDFRPGQLTALQALSAGENTLAILPTGAGKTLIYECFGYTSHQTVLVVSPLLSLMADQVRTMNLRGESAVIAVTSMVSYVEKREVMANLGAYQFIFTSPEMLTQPAFLTALKATNIGLMVVDEAHCISTWGPDFRPEYLLLANVRQALEAPLTLMVTATATPQVKEDILTKMNLQNATQVTLSVDRPNVYLGVAQVADESAKRLKLLSLVQQLERPGIIYFSSRQTADDVTVFLQQNGISRIAAYHGGLSDESRYKVQQQFMTGQLQLICATSAFGMGIDKADIRFVIHYHIPVDLESYWQEIGRAGRDGGQSLAVMLYSPGDEQLANYLGQANMVEDDDISAFFQRPHQVSDDDPLRLVAFYYQHHKTESQVKKLFEQRRKQRRQALFDLLQYVRSTGCRRQVVRQYFGEDDQPSVDPCCDNDTPELTVADLGLVAKPISTPELTVLPWQKTIERLFLGKS